MNFYMGLYRRNLQEVMVSVVDGEESNTCYTAAISACLEALIVSGSACAQPRLTDSFDCQLPDRCCRFLGYLKTAAKAFTPNHGPLAWAPNLESLHNHHIQLYTIQELGANTSDPSKKKRKVQGSKLGAHTFSLTWTPEVCNNPRQKKQKGARVQIRCPCFQP